MIKPAFWIFVLYSLFTQSLEAQIPQFDLVGFGELATGGEGGNVVTVTDLSSLRSSLLKKEALVIQINGQISGIFSTKDAEKDANLLEVTSNKTVIGLGDNARLTNIQLYLKNAQNVIVRNLQFTMIGSSLGGDADMISIATTSNGVCKNIWIDHCEFYNVTPTLPETASKKDLYDGMIDIKKESYNITISWNYFHDHWKCSLIGFTDTDTIDRKITYHHNYFQNIKSRVPSYRGGTAHIFNNYFEGLPDRNTQPTSEGVNSREHACLRVEANYFKDYKNTIYTALDDVTFPGYVMASGNVFENSGGVNADSCTLEIPYAYQLDDVMALPDILKMWTGTGKINLVSIKNDSKEPGFSLGNNPVTDVLDVRIESSVASSIVLDVLDAGGKSWTRKQIELSTGVINAQLGIDHIPPGIYFLRLRSVDHQKSIRFLKI